MAKINIVFRKDKLNKQSKGPYIEELSESFVFTIEIVDSKIHQFLLCFYVNNFFRIVGKFIIT